MQSSGGSLLAACWKGHAECVRLLLDRGASVDAADVPVDEADVSSWLVVRVRRRPVRCGASWVFVCESTATGRRGHFI